MSLCQTCKGYAKYNTDNDFWAYLIVNKFHVPLNFKNNKYKFLDMTIWNTIKPYVARHDEARLKFIKKYDNVLVIKIVGCSDLYYFVIQINNRNSLIKRQRLYCDSYFLHSQKDSELVIINPLNKNIVVVDTKICKIITEWSTDISSSIFAMFSEILITGLEESIVGYTKITSIPLYWIFRPVVCLLN